MDAIRAYDGEGNRVQQTTTTRGVIATTSYIGRLEEVSVTSRGSTSTTAHYGGVALSVNSALSYLLSDGLGSVTASVSTSSGAVTATQLYSPYGSVRYTSGTLPTSYGYTGQRADAATGLDYYHAATTTRRRAVHQRRYDASRWAESLRLCRRQPHDAHRSQRPLPLALPLYR